MKNSKTSLFNIVNIGLLFLLALTCLLPMLNVASKSFSSEAAISMGRVWIWPSDITFDAYKFILTGNFFKPFMIQLIITLVGTSLSLFLLFMLAYPLTRKEVLVKKQIMMLVVFTMLFNAGIIPNYLLINELGLLNNVFSVILPVAFSGFNFLIVKSYMQSLPESIVESALVEGAKHTRILVSIVIPFCVPVLATMVLFNIVMYWNSYFTAMIYLTKPELKPLQVFLREIVLYSLKEISSDYVYEPDSVISRSPEAIRAASIVATTLPVLIVFPFLQKYYIKGLTLGAVKG